MKRTKSGRAFGLFCVTMAVTILAAASPAVAQDDAAPDDSVVATAMEFEPVPRDQVVGPFKVDDGSYIGTVAYSYSLTMGQGGITLWLHRDGSGPATFQVVAEAMTGQWSLADTGGLSILEHPGLAEADAVGQASGTLSGSFPYTFAGSYASDVKATVDASAVGGPNISATDSGSGTTELSFEFTESVQVCGQIQANWDESFRSQFAEIGWETSVKTQLVAFPETGDDEIQARIGALIETATFAANQLSGPEHAIEFMVDVILESESIMSAIDSYPQTCPLDNAFLRIVNNVLRDITNTLLDQWQSEDADVGMIVLRRLVEIDLRAGVLGSGAVDQPAAEFLKEKILRIVQERFDELIETTSDHGDLKQAVLVAEMLGHQLSDVSNVDLCVVLGGC